MLDAFVGNPPKNASGGLNMVWAVEQALKKLGVEAPNSDIRKFIAREYVKLGREAIDKKHAISNAMWATRKKVQLEIDSTPPVPMKPVIAAAVVAPVPAVIPSKVGIVTSLAKNAKGHSKEVLLEFQNHVLDVIKPAMEVIEANGGIEAWEDLKTLVAHCKEE